MHALQGQEWNFQVEPAPWVEHMGDPAPADEDGEAAADAGRPGVVTPSVDSAADEKE